MAEFEFRDVKSDRSDQVELPNKYTDILDADFIIRGNLSNWEILYFRVRNESGNVHSLGAEKVTRSISATELMSIAENRASNMIVNTYLHTTVISITDLTRAFDIR